MFCRRCGAQISDQARFCPKCGTKVAASASARVSSARRPGRDLETVAAILLGASLAAQIVMFLLSIGTAVGSLSFYGTSTAAASAVAFAACGFLLCGLYVKQSLSDSRRCFVAA